MAVGLRASPGPNEKRVTVSPVSRHSQIAGSVIPSYRALDYETLPARKWFAGGRREGRATDTVRIRMVSVPREGTACRPEAERPGCRPGSDPFSGHRRGTGGEEPTGASAGAAGWSCTGSA